MTKINILLACVFSCLLLTSKAQEEKSWEPDESYDDDVRYREVILNATPLIAQFVPFNASTVSRFNIFDYEYRRFKNGKGWRWSLGVNVSAALNDPDPQAIYMRFGFLKKRQISPRFHFVRTWDLNLVAENPEGVSPGAQKLNFSGLGLSYSAGIEYRINSQMALSTEGILFLGLLPIDDFTGGGLIRFIPPVGLFFHFKF